MTPEDPRRMFVCPIVDAESAGQPSPERQIDVHLIGSTGTCAAGERVVHLRKLTRAR